MELSAMLDHQKQSDVGSSRLTRRPFQLIIATPIKSVMTIEPYVGGAAFVHIEDRKHSKVCVLPYDEETQRIDYTPVGVPLADNAHP